MKTVSGLTLDQPMAARRHFTRDQAISLFSLLAFIILMAMPAPDNDKIEAIAQSLSDPLKNQTYGPREISVSGYSGIPYTHPSDVQLERSSDKTDLTIKQMPWIGRPFRHPIYYGYRLNGWTGTSPFGGMIDFTHNKTIGIAKGKTGKIESDRLSTSGTFKGETIEGLRKPEDFFRKLELSHGHNTLTLNGAMRLPFGSSRVRPYIAAGGGIAIPHFEIHVQGDEKRTYEYKWVGSGWQILGGVEFPLSNNFALFVEYKLVYAPINGELSTPGGGHIRTKLWSHQIVGGFTFRKVSAR